VALVAGMLAWGRAPAGAAELRLRPQCTSSSGVVTLGDVAEIFTADRQQADTLAAVELFSTPSPSRQRFVRLREIQDLLILRGVNLTEHRFSGSSQVAVHGGGEPARTEAEPPLSAAVLRRANLRVQEAIIQYLQQRAGASQPWTVEIDLGQSQARAVSNSTRAISVSGGASPWTGTQRFEVTVDSPGQPAQFTVDAQVGTTPAVVVALRSLARGVVIRDTDVELQRGLPREASSDAFSSLDEVVGKETTRAIPVGKVIPRDALRAPLLVRRGEIVTVYASSAGIRVRTTARARDDGSLGDLVAVESVHDRSTYFARVDGVREVEVFAHSVQAAGPPTAKAAPLARRQATKPGPDKERN
jgi:flagella basal body P-ring formation protein FlgA